LKKYRDYLEETIKEKTKEIDEKKNLDNAIKVFVGREQIIRSLKKQ
jgi:hypothetical protein